MRMLPLFLSGAHGHCVLPLLFDLCLLFVLLKNSPLCMIVSPSLLEAYYLSESCSRDPAILFVIRATQCDEFARGPEHDIGTGLYLMIFTAVATRLVSRFLQVLRGVFSRLSPLARICPGMSRAASLAVKQGGRN